MESAMGGYVGGLGSTTTDCNTFGINDRSGVLVGELAPWTMYPCYSYTPPSPSQTGGEQCPCCNEKWKRRKADKGEKGDRRKRPKRRKKAGD